MQKCTDGSKVPFQTNCSLRQSSQSSQRASIRAAVVAVAVVAVVVVVVKCRHRRGRQRRRRHRHRRRRQRLSATILTSQLRHLSDKSRSFVAFVPPGPFNWTESKFSHINVRFFSLFHSSAKMLLYSCFISNQAKTLLFALPLATAIIIIQLIMSASFINAKVVMRFKDG